MATIAMIPIYSYMSRYTENLTAFLSRYIVKFYQSADMVYRMVPNIPQVMLIVVCGSTALLSSLLEVIADSILGLFLMQS